MDNRSPFKHPDAEASAQLVGGKVGAEALKVLFTMEPGDAGAGRNADEGAATPRRPPAAGARAAVPGPRAAGPAKVGQTEWTFAKEIVMLDAMLKKEPSVEVEVQAVQVGPAVFVTTPAEYFCQFGLDQKARSGFPFTFPVSLANGCVGYVPTEEAFAEGGGGYETRLTSYSNLEITAGRRCATPGSSWRSSSRLEACRSERGRRRSRGSRGRMAMSSRNISRDSAVGAGLCARQGSRHRGGTEACYHWGLNSLAARLAPPLTRPRSPARVPRSDCSQTPVPVPGPSTRATIRSRRLETPAATWYWFSATAAGRSRPRR